MRIQSIKFQLNLWFSLSLNVIGLTYPGYKHFRVTRRTSKIRSEEILPIYPTESEIVHHKEQQGIVATSRAMGAQQKPPQAKTPCVCSEIISDCNTLATTAFPPWMKRDSPNLIAD